MALQRQGVRLLERRNCGSIFPVASKPQVGYRYRDPRCSAYSRNILSAYDDLIENNRRRIALLEEAARMLYREWFVHFRFPGHQHDKVVNGLPEGWSAGSSATYSPCKGDMIFQRGIA